MKKVMIVVIILIIGLCVAMWVYGNNIPSQKIAQNNVKSLNELYMSENSINEITENPEPVNVPRKKAYYDQDGFVTDSLYIDCQIYCEYENENIKSAIDTKIEEIKNRISEEQANTSGMVVINLSGSTKLHEKINVIEYTETFRKYKMLKTYFDDTFYKVIMAESNKPENSNIFNVDLENNKNISYTDQQETSYYSVKTGQKLQNVSDLFSSTYDYSSVIKERVKYMLDLNVGHTEGEVNKKVEDAYNKLNIDVDLLNETLIISLENDGFQMFFNEFDKSEMTIY